MKLKDTISISDFLQSISSCRGDVLYTTAEGDCLNLSSTLSGYIFLALADAPNRSFLQNGDITCSEAADYELLRDFWE